MENLIKKSFQICLACHISSGYDLISLLYLISVGKPEEKRPLGIPRHGWEDNINMNLREIGWGGMDWIHLAQDRDQWRARVNTAKNVRLPHNFGNFLGS
jgi:hypothetical protein